MRPLARRVGLLALLLPQVLHAQGRQTKVNYDETVKLGSQALVAGHSTYFHILTTPADEDPDGGLIRYWGPELDRFYENVCANLQLGPDEVRRYLLYPDLFAELEQLVLEGRLHTAWTDSILGALDSHPRGHDASTDAVGSPQADPETAVDVPPARVGGAPLRIDRPAEAPNGFVFETEPRERRWHDRYTEWSGEALVVWLPDASQRLFQRCVLYRTLHDFLATPIGPSLPEGVLGFVPRHDPKLPIVIYASLGEERLRRTAQHEIAHAVVETIAKYHRRLAVARVRNAKSAAPAEGWKPQRGGFSAITHENFAEYLSFPHRQMDPNLRAALIEMVAENRLDGLAALSVGARTLASSYVEGPARLTFLADRFGRDMPKKLLHGYYTNSLGFLNVLEDLTGYSIEALEQLYRRWLREWMWADHLTTAIPDTTGTVLATALSGVHRDGATLVHRARNGRLEIALMEPGNSRRDAQTHIVARELEGIERLPLFTTPDLRHGHVVSVVRNQNKEALLFWSVERGATLRELSELGSVREVRDPRFSPSGHRVVFRVVDRSGRNALGLLDRQADRARLLTSWQWTQVADPTFADDETWVLYSSTDTPDHHADVLALHVDTGEIRNLSNTPGVSETEPLLVNGRLVCFSDRSGVPQPVAWIPGESPRLLLNLPFAMSGMERSDSTLTLVANSLRHRRLPAQRALWSFPLQRLGLDTQPAPAVLARHEALPALALLAGAPASVHENTAESDAGVASPAEAALPAWLGPAPTSPALDVALGQSSGADPAPGIDVKPYRQKWRLMPLGINVTNTDARARGVSFLGIDTEFHDQSFLVAAGQRAEFDRFATLMYRNRSARMHWDGGIYHRSILRGRFDVDSTSTYDETQTETGVVLGAQYHKSLVTRLGFGMALSHRTDTEGDVIVHRDNQEAMGLDAPVLAARFGGLDPRAWQLGLGGLEDVAMLADESSVGLAQFANAARQLAADAEREFIPSVEYVRSNMTIGMSLSRDTRVWSDYRGPRAGSLLTISATTGFNAPGEITFLNGARQDSLQHRVSAGLDRIGVAAMFLTHRRITFVDLAWRVRAFADDGPGELIYGLGGLYSVAGYPRGFLRSPRVAYTNLETRAPLWNYGLLPLPIKSLVLPAGEGFLFLDAGVADGGGSIWSYGVGLRLRLGFLTYEWRHQLREGLRNQNGLVLAW